MKKLRISEIAKVKKVARTTVLSWIRDGLLKGAVLNESGIVPFWEVPEKEVTAFKPPDRGRPAAKPKQGKIAA